MELLATQEEALAEYRARLEQRRAAHDRYARLDWALGNWRLMVFGVGAALGALVFWLNDFLPLLLAPLAAFLALVVFHDRTIRRKRKAERAVAFYEHGLRRLENTWAGHGVSGSRFADPTHPYAEDFDLFGTGSLFERLCTARTHAGEACLADWLRAPATPETIRARQEAVAELRPCLDLREELALLGEEVRSTVHPERLTAWGEKPPLLRTNGVPVTAGLLTFGVLGGLAAWALGWGLVPFGVLLFAQQAFDLTLRKRVRRVVRGVDGPARQLELLAELLARLERESFASARLREVRDALSLDGLPPSRRIATLETLVEYLDMRRNIFFAPLGGLLLWTTQFACAIEQWRIENGRYLAHWLRIVGEFEALSALSAFAYENPEDPFPEIVTTEACFVAKGLAHPLLPPAQAVRNDITLGEPTRLFIVSGSNMSGKSTLLRTIGTNTVLALCGAPVRARSLRVSVLHLGASIRTQDSLQAGISRFYAEITRLRQIVDIAREQPPLLFCLDEILHGTNSHDRRVGAEAVVRALLAGDALGLMTTHDLALAQITEDAALQAVNVHFEDHLEDGKMVFDYHLHPGVVTRSNAIALMRAVGLEV